MPKKLILAAPNLHGHDEIYIYGPTQLGRSDGVNIKPGDEARTYSTRDVPREFGELELAVQIIGDDLVSRHHCGIIPIGRSMTERVLIDVGSRNGTYVNDVKLQPRERRKLEQNQVI